jgi:ATP-dependent phosphofructokinase / diphosphate-dependent phosphofructokinase
MYNLLITMSGGTTTVINATLAGVIKKVQESSLIDKIYAGVPGITGVLEDNLVEISSLTEHDLIKLKRTPSSGIIGTTRVKQFDKDELTIFRKQLKKYNITYFINIGGNGTIKQTKYLVNNIEGLKAISLPKTVDNDLGDDLLEDMYFTPGFPSVVNYWMHKLYMLNNENLGASSHDKVLIAQTFGRDTGFIAGAVRVADPHRKLPLLILLPEDQKDINEVIDAIKKTIVKFGRAIVVMAEGYNIGDVGEVNDYSGQVMFSSSKNLAAQLLVNKCIENGIQARAFIPGIDQRSDITFTTNFDIDCSYNLGKYAIEELEKGYFNFLVGIVNKGKQIQYKRIEYSSFENLSRNLDNKFIKKNEFDVSNEYLEYLENIIDDRKHLIIDEELTIDSFFRIK